MERVPADPVQRNGDRPGRCAGEGSESGPSAAHLVRTLSLRCAVSGDARTRVAQIGAVQRGRVARRQLLAAGVSRGTITRLLASGHLFRLGRGVYAVGHPGPVPLGPETEALLACRDGAVLSHGTAGALWGLRRTPADAPIDVMLLGSEGSRSERTRLRRTRELPPVDVRIHEHLPVTSPARTLLDLGDILSSTDLEWALDEALVVRRIVRRAEVEDVVARLPSRTGAALLRAMLAARTRTGATRSEAEQRCLVLIRSGGLPEPERNAEIGNFTVDFLWRRQRVVVEIDGYRYHSSRSAFERDRRKDAALRAAGFEVIRVTWRQLVEEPLSVIAQISLTLGRRDQHPV